MSVFCYAARSKSVPQHFYCYWHKECLRESARSHPDIFYTGYCDDSPVMHLYVCVSCSRCINAPAKEAERSEYAYTTLDMARKWQIEQGYSVWSV